MLVISLTNCSACDVRTVTHVGNLRRSGELMISVVVSMAGARIPPTHDVFDVLCANFLVQKSQFLGQRLLNK